MMMYFGWKTFSQLKNREKKCKINGCTFSRLTDFSQRLCWADSNQACFCCCYYCCCYLYFIGNETKTQLVCNHSAKKCRHAHIKSKRHAHNVGIINFWFGISLKYNFFFAIIFNVISRLRRRLQVFIALANAQDYDGKLFFFVQFSCNECCDIIYISVIVCVRPQSAIFSVHFRRKARAQSIRSRPGWRNRSASKVPHCLPTIAKWIRSLTGPVWYARKSMIPMKLRIIWRYSILVVAAYWNETYVARLFCWWKCSNQSKISYAFSIRVLCTFAFGSRNFLALSCNPTRSWLSCASHRSRQSFRTRLPDLLVVCKCSHLIQANQTVQPAVWIKKK